MASRVSSGHLQYLHRQDLSNWNETLALMGCSDHSISTFGLLAARDSMGRAEACRLLAHLTKPGQPLRDPSRWLESAVAEALEYIGGEWRHWESRAPVLSGLKGSGKTRDPQWREWAATVSAPPGRRDAAGAWAPPAWEPQPPAPQALADPRAPADPNPWARYTPGGGGGGASSSSGR